MSTTRPVGTGSDAAASDAPERRGRHVRPRSEADLGWTRRPMVRWFSPGMLLETGLRAALASVFGTYADRREVQAALQRGGVLDADGGGRLFEDYSREDELWLDYVADLGDGFASTYTIAWLLGRERLRPSAAGAGADGRPETRRGRVLIMGGDQVYPTASRREYADRLVGPYEAALPWHDEASAPHLYAIPGNHDWYDGLTSFLRLFCQGRWIGGWCTRQSRSYFALKLPQRWWLLGIDVQLDSDIDRPQLDYFRTVSRSMEEGDRVILCTAQPCWVTTATRPDAFDNLVYFEEEVLAPRKAELALTLTGDLHHYARYSSADRRRHKITAGGGGAYLYPTHRLPCVLDLPRARGFEREAGGARDSETFMLAETYPEAGRSRALRAGALRLAWTNKAFTALIGAVYLLYAWLLQSASRPVGLEHGWTDGVLGLARSGSATGWLDPLEAYWTVLRHAPALALLTAAFVAGLVAFCNPDPGASESDRHRRGSGIGRHARKWAIGLAHGLAHVALVVALAWAFAVLNHTLTGLAVDSTGHVLLFAAELWLVGGILGATLMGCALLPGVNMNEAFSCQNLEGFKNFVRLHIDDEGTLRVYAFGVDAAVGRDRGLAAWRFSASDAEGAPYFEPVGRAPAPRLVDAVPPIPGAPRPAPAGGADRLENPS